MKADLQSVDFITATEARTLSGLFAARVQRSPYMIAYQQYDAQTESWRDYSWRDMQTLVARWQAALIQENLQPGDRVATLLGNGVDWVCFEQAAQSLGLVIVALYTTDTPANLSYILADAGVRVLLVEELAQWQVFTGKQEELPGLQRVWYLREEKKKVYARLEF